MLMYERHIYATYPSRSGSSVMSVLAGCVSPERVDGGGEAGEENVTHERRVVAVQEVRYRPGGRGNLGSVSYVVVRADGVNRSYGATVQPDGTLTGVDTGYNPTQRMLERQGSRVVDQWTEELSYGASREVTVHRPMDAICVNMTDGPVFSGC